MVQRSVMPGKRGVLAALWVAWRQPVGATVVLAVAMIGLWKWAIVFNHWQPYFVPTPSMVGDVIAHRPDEYATDLVTTLKEAALGFLIGNGCGYALALIFLVWRRLSLMMYPIAVGFQAVPVVVFVPLLTLLLGHGLPAIIAVTTLICFFPTLLSVSRGLRTISPSAQDLFHLTAASRWEYVRYLAMPWSLPYLFNGLRTGAPASVLGALVAEWVAGSHGLGIGMVTQSTAENMPLLWADGILSIFLVLGFTALVAMVERAALWWHGN